MDTQTLLIGLSFVLCALLSAVFFAFFIKKESFRNRLMTVSLSVLCSSVITIGLISTIGWFPYDFVYDMSLVKFLLTLSSFLVVLAFLLIKNSRFIAFGIFLASCLCVLGPDLYITILPEKYALLNKLLTIFILYSYSMGFRSLSGINSYAQIQGIVIAGGITLLYIFGQAPFVLGISSSSILSAFLIAYLYSKEQPLGIQNSPCLGFILGWLGLLSVHEFLTPCFIIFSMLYLSEFAICLARKLTFLKKYSNLAYNSIFLQALSNGLPIATLVKHLINIDGLLLIIGVFQIASSSSQSLVSFAFIVTIWQIYRVATWQEETKTLKEAGQEIKTQIKETFEKIKSNKQPSKKRTNKKK